MLHTMTLRHFGRTPCITVLMFRVSVTRHIEKGQLSYTTGGLYTACIPVRAHTEISSRGYTNCNMIKPIITVTGGPYAPLEAPLGPYYLYQIRIIMCFDCLDSPGFP